MPRILVAEPDADTRALYRQSFTDAGCEVVEAEDGRDALVKALVRVPSLVVTELRLPFISGVQLCAILRHDHATESVPVVIVTTETRPNQVDRARRAGADVVLAKPTPCEMILREARRLLLHSQDLRERSVTVLHKAAAQLERSAMVRARSAQLPRPTFARSHQRNFTTRPPLPPPGLSCPSCDRALTYQFTHVGGVSERFLEQWDCFTCPMCGTYEYRHRTRKVRRLGVDEERWVKAFKISGS